MRRFNLEEWTPNSMEKKCLDHLDSVENWESLLKRPKPPETERLSWRPFVKIFAFNCGFFALVVALILAVVAIGTVGFESLQAEFAYFAITVVLISAGTAAYTTNLYRRSWNRRAAQTLSSQNEN